MALHLIKLCVGAESVDDLQEWIDLRLRMSGEQVHTTRMVPKRADEIVGEGSLYWVIKGVILVRQRIIAIEEVTDDHGVRCGLILDPPLIRTAPQPRRAFQGWRYLAQKDAPADMSDGQKGLLEMPRELREELASLGLL